MIRAGGGTNRDSVALHLHPICGNQSAMTVEMKIESVYLLIVPFGLVLAGFVIGKIFQRIAVKRLGVMAQRSGWKRYDILVGSIASVAVLWTSLFGIYSAVMSLPLRPDVSEYLRKLIMSAYIISATFVIARIAVGYVHAHAVKMREVLPETTIFSNITRIAIYALGALILLQSLGVSITPVLGALGVGGL